MAAKSKSNNKITNLILGSNLTIDKVIEINKQFKAQIKEKNDIKLVSDKIEIIDLAGIQFLIYAKKRAAKEGINLSINCKLSDTATEITEKTGFNKLFQDK